MDLGKNFLKKNMHREDMRREINLKLFISLPQTAPCKQGVRVGANRSLQAGSPSFILNPAEKVN